MPHPSDVLVALNTGPFATTGAAYARDGREIALVSASTRPQFVEGGGVEQDLAEAWHTALKALRLLADEVPDLAHRAAALAITGQSDGTWLIDEDGDPVAPAMLWLDARPGSMLETWRQSGIGERVREITGSALEPARQSAQLAWLLRHRPEVVGQAATALQAKDWLYFCCTGERATDPASAMSSYGNLVSGGYDEHVLELLGLEGIGQILPAMIEGTRHFGELSLPAAAATGLRAGMPVVLAPPDGIAAALAAGAFDPGEPVGCTILDSAGVHLRIGPRPDALSSVARAGAIVPFAVPGTWASTIPSPAAGLYVEWLIELAWQLVADVGLIGMSRRDIAALLDARAAEARPATLVFRPAIAAGPSVAPDARAQLTGLSCQSGLGDLTRAVYEGLAFAACDGHAALGHTPKEIRIGGALAASPVVRRVLAACLGRPVRGCLRRDAASSGAALVAAVALGQYGGVVEALTDWVEPHLGEPEVPDRELAALYRTCRTARSCACPVLSGLDRGQV